MYKSIFPTHVSLFFLFFLAAIGDTFSQVDPPLDINQLIAEGRVTVAHTEFDIGDINLVFDDDSSSLARTAGINPLNITLTFDRPITITASSIFKSYGSGEWSLETADNQLDLDGKIGSYQQLFTRSITTFEPNFFFGRSDFTSFVPITTKIIRLTVVKTTGGDLVHLHNWTLNGQFVENNAKACSDGIDNDGDGLIDCLDPDCDDLANDGCTTCGSGISFADFLITYEPGCPLADPDPGGAVGISDWSSSCCDEPSAVFLGQGGTIKLGFSNNRLTNSGNADPDVFVFEVGGLVETCDIAIRPADDATTAILLQENIPDTNGDGFFEIGQISGTSSSLDIDAVLTGYAQHQLKFDAVSVTDVDDDACGGDTPGADIDAVCALSSIPFGIGFNEVCQDTDLILNENPVLEITYKTTQSIVSAGTIANGSEVTFQAAQGITLSPGFVAETGSSFIARVDACTPTALAQKPEIVQDKKVGSDLDLPEERSTSEHQLLWQVNPNPVQSRAVITYDLPNESQVTLRIIDLMGREIKPILTNTIQNPGIHEVSFNSSSLSSGLYTIQLNVAGIVHQKRIVVHK